MIFVHIFPSAPCCYEPHNAMSQRLELNVTICGRIMTVWHYCWQCQIVWSSIEFETMTPSATRGPGLWCILTLVYYCDWLGISVCGPGNMRAGAAGLNVNQYLELVSTGVHWWPLVPHCPASELVTPLTTSGPSNELTTGWLLVIGRAWSRDLDTGL